MQNIAVLILAAGLGTRMKSTLPKVNHEVAGRSMLAHVQAVGECLHAERLITVLGPENRDLECTGPVVIQEDRRGTGHAVQIAAPQLQGFAGWVLVLYGDSALIRAETLQSMLEKGEAAQADLMVTGFEPQDPAKYGRLVVENGKLDRIVEFKDASDDERAIGLCNGGIMALRAPFCLPLLDQLSDKNAAGELYLTDMVALVNAAGGTCLVEICPEEELKGVNNRQELSEVEAIMQARLRANLMMQGVTLQDPSSVHLCFDTQIGADTIVEPHQVFGAGVTVGGGAHLKAFGHYESARIGQGAVVGPYARLRPGTVLGSGVKIGNFVEVKKADIAAGAKVNHLSYIGDAEVGAGANIGAGTITCNYDGFNKHKTVIGAGAFIGSNSALIAPVTIGDGAIVGAGSAVSKSVNTDALAIVRAEQRNVEGGAARLRAKFARAKAKKAQS